MDFYIEYINKNIDWVELQEYFVINECIYLQDLIQIANFYDGKLMEDEVRRNMENGAQGGVSYEWTNPLKCERLVAIGLVESEVTNILHSRDDNKMRKKYICYGGVDILNRLKINFKYKMKKYIKVLSYIFSVIGSFRRKK